MHCSSDSTESNVRTFANSTHFEEGLASPKVPGSPILPNLMPNKSVRDHISSEDDDSSDDEGPLLIPIDKIAGTDYTPAADGNTSAINTNDDTQIPEEDEEKEESNGPIELKYILSQMGARHIVFNGYRYVY